MAATASLSVLLQAVTGDFDKKMKKSSKKVTTMSKVVKVASKAFAAFGVAAVAGVTAAIVAMTKAAFTSIDALGKYAQRLGIATEELQKLQFAAKLSAGVTDSTLNMALQRMTRRLSEAAQGTGEAVNAIKELGLSAQALAALSPDQQFRMIADAMARVSSQADRVRLSFKLFDSEGVALVNTLALGSKGLDELGDKLEKTGGLISQEMTLKIAAANDAMALLAETTKALAARLAIDLAPAIQFVVEKLEDYIQKMNESSMVSAGPGGFTTVMLVMLQALKLVEAALNGLAIVFDVVVIAVAGVGGIILKVVSGFGLFSKAINDLANDFFFFARGAAEDIGMLAGSLNENLFGPSSFAEFEEFQKKQREEIKKTMEEIRKAQEDATAATEEAARKQLSITGAAGAAAVAAAARVAEKTAEIGKNALETVVAPLRIMRKELREVAMMTTGGGGGTPGGGGRSFRFRESIEANRVEKDQLSVLEQIRDILNNPNPNQLIINEVGI